MTIFGRLATALLLLFCLAPLGKPLGTVLCFGADGHIGFEPFHHRAHNTSAAMLAESREEAAQARADILDPGACVDVTLSARESDGQLLPVPNAYPQPETSGFVPGLLLGPVSTEHPAPPSLTDASLFHTSCLTILRSVVLRI